MDGMAGLSEQSSRWFEDFRLGERFPLPARELEPKAFQAFSELSGEMHPSHTDEGWSAAHGMPGMLAHGFLLLARTAAGAGSFPFVVERALVGLVEQSCRFVRPAHVGDVLTVLLTVTELAPNTHTGVVGLRSTAHNQRRELVLDGMQRWLLRRRPS